MSSGTQAASAAANARRANCWASAGRFHRFGVGENQQQRRRATVVDAQVPGPQGKRASRRRFGLLEAVVDAVQPGKVAQHLGDQQRGLPGDFFSHAQGLGVQLHRQRVARLLFGQVRQRAKRFDGGGASTQRVEGIGGGRADLLVGPLGLPLVNQGSVRPRGLLRTRRP
jgi:hypothetical protein